MQMCQHVLKISQYPNAKVIARFQLHPRLKVGTYQYVKICMHAVRGRDVWRNQAKATDMMQSNSNKSIMTIWFKPINQSSLVL